MRVEKTDLIREITAYQGHLRANARRRERYRCKTGRKRPRPKPVQPSEELGRLLLQLARNLAEHPSWRSYTWRDDLVSAAMPALLYACARFDLSKETSPFAYLTTSAWRAFSRENEKLKRRGVVGSYDADFEMISMPTLSLGNFGGSAQDGRFGRRTGSASVEA